MTFAGGAMNQFQHLLVPVSFSPKSGAALKRAIELAARYTAQISLLHVCSTGECGHCTARLKQLQGLVTAEANVPVIPICRTGDPVQQILLAAHELSTDLIVMATHSATDGARWVRGSVADQVLRSAPCPVLAVRAKSRPERAEAATLSALR